MAKWRHDAGHEQRTHQDHASDEDDPSFGQPELEVSEAVVSLPRPLEGSSQLVGLAFTYLGGGSEKRLNVVRAVVVYLLSARCNT